MKTTNEQQQARHEEIARRAKEIWEREGRQTGHDVEYWLRAERELRPRVSPQAGAPPDRTAAARENKRPAGNARVLHI